MEMEIGEPYLEKIVKSTYRHSMVFEFPYCGKSEMLLLDLYKADIDIWNGQPLNDFGSIIPFYSNKIFIIAAAKL